jgi:hypothetical protein
MLVPGVLLVLLVALAAISLSRRPEGITPMAVFAAPWTVGLLAVVGRPAGQLGWDTFGVVAAGSIYLFAGERLVRSDEGNPAKHPGGGTNTARLYWTLTAVAVAATVLKLRSSYEATGGDLEAMLVLNAVRAAVTEGSLVFSPVVTALASAMYVAAALTGYLCRDRIRPRYLAHVAAAAIDSAATSGRGSFLIVSMITLIGLGVAWHGPRRQVLLALGGAAVGVIGLALGLSLVIGRGDVGETLWEYIVGPLYGLEAYLKAEPPSGIHGPTLISALTAKLGGATYDAGDFAWTSPFMGNVSSGFREVLTDTGRAGLGLFIPMGAATMAAHRGFRLRGTWAPYAVAVSLYAYLGYFYYVSLGAFLPGWWVLLFSGAAAAVLSRGRGGGPVARRALASSGRLRPEQPVLDSGRRGRLETE